MSWKSIWIYLKSEMVLSRLKTYFKLGMWYNVLYSTWSHDKIEYTYMTKVVIEKSHGEGSLMEQETIENVS